MRLTINKSSVPQIPALAEGEKPGLNPESTLTNGPPNKGEVFKKFYKTALVVSMSYLYVLVKSTRLISHA